MFACGARAFAMSVSLRPIMLRRQTKYCDDRLTTPLASPPTALAEMRLAQAAAAAAVPGTSLVTALDLGSVHSQAGSCHSAQKPELGRRLACALKAAVYDNRTTWESPVVRSVSHVGNSSVVVVFSAPGGGGLALDTSARCPAAILPVFCRCVTWNLNSMQLETPAQWTEYRLIKLTC